MTRASLGIRTWALLSSNRSSPLLSSKLTTYLTSLLGNISKMDKPYYLAAMLVSAPKADTILA